MTEIATAPEFVLVPLSPRRQLEVAAMKDDPRGEHMKLEVLLCGHPTGWRLFLKPTCARSLAHALFKLSDQQLGFTTTITAAATPTLAAGASASPPPELSHG